MKYLFAVLIMTAALANGQSEPNLHDTTTFMENFVEAHGHWINDDGSIGLEVVSVIECKVTVHSELIKNDTLVRTPADATWSFSLGDLDPNTVKTVVPLDHHPSAYTQFETTDSKPLISLGRRDGHAEPLLAGWEINLDSKEDADRFTKAFKHAVILCGGKPSTF